MRFEFATAGRILFGAGVVHEVAPLAECMVPPGERRALVVTGRSSRRAQPLMDALVERGFHCEPLSIPREPTTDVIRSGTQRAKESRCHLVIGFGGGSPLDAGKAIAAMMRQPGELFDYLEVIGQGNQLVHMPVPYIAIPTTAGTGTEVTRNAVLMSPEHKVKVSLRSPGMLPRLAVVDPELTHGLPPAITASTGLDALTQLMEAYVSIRSNPITDGICREGMMRVSRSLREAYQGAILGTENLSARQDMSLASLMGGLVLANASLGVVHGFASPFGGMFDAPHGAVCAALLPHGMAINVTAMQYREPGNPILQRYDEVARILTHHPNASAVDGVRWVQELCKMLQIPSLATYGLTRDDMPVLIEKAAASSSMKGNPIHLSRDELHEILDRTFD
ncbi:MAG: iron-containing alcohol dehydrogenase [Pirellulales bacterium]|nr:iron-containing alcohol dehydrogenase [Pirellulales bacterium]